MYYIATSIPYINGNLHLGHLTEALYNDALARFFRLKLGYENVIFSMGLDQNGLKNYQKSQELGIDIYEYVNRETQKAKNLWQKMEISHNTFTETSTPKHKVVSQIVWQKLAKKELIYQKNFVGKYCVGCETYYTDSQLNNEGKCPIHLTFPIEMKEKNYFFKLSKFQEEIKNYLTTSKILPTSTVKEMLNFVEDGLEDISISREKINLPWGVVVPNDDSQVIYIWFEALINYLTALVDQESTDKYLEFPYQKDEFEGEIWQQIKEKMPIDLQYLGKDVVRFHLIIWQAMLISLDLPATKTTIVHGFINDKNNFKMSKSLGNVILPEELLNIFDVDGTRYVMFYEVNNFEDTPFDLERCKQSYNANLVDNLGNLLSRITNLIEKNLNGNLDIINYNQKDLQKLNIDISLIYSNLDEFNIQKAIHNLFLEFTKINKFLEQNKPWELAKDKTKNIQKITEVLNLSAFSLLELTKVLAIFLPFTSQRIIEVLNTPKIIKYNNLFIKL